MNDRIKRIKDEAIKGSRQQWWSEKPSYMHQPWFMTMDCGEMLFLINELEYQTDEAARARNDYSARNAQCVLLEQEVRALRKGMQELLDSPPRGNA